VIILSDGPWVPITHLCPLTSDCPEFQRVSSGSDTDDPAQSCSDVLLETRHSRREVIAETLRRVLLWRQCPRRIAGQPLPGPRAGRELAFSPGTLGLGWVRNARVGVPGRDGGPWLISSSTLMAALPT